MGGTVLVFDLQNFKYDLFLSFFPIYIELYRDPYYICDQETASES